MAFRNAFLQVAAYFQRFDEAESLYREIDRKAEAASNGPDFRARFKECVEVSASNFRTLPLICEYALATGSE